MSEESTHPGTGRWIALATAIITLVGTAVSAGLIRANADDQNKGSDVRNVVTPVSSSTSSPTPSPVSTTASTWRVDAVQVCDAAQESAAKADKAYSGRADKLDAMVSIVHVMDQLLRELDIPEPEHSRVQLMTSQWDQAYAAVEQMLDAEAVHDAMTANDRLSQFTDLNGRGNQVAEDLRIARCAAVGLPSMGGN